MYTKTEAEQWKALKAKCLRKVSVGLGVNVLKKKKNVSAISGYKLEVSASFCF